MSVMTSPETVLHSARKGARTITPEDLWALPRVGDRISNGRVHHAIDGDRAVVVEGECGELHPGIDTFLPWVRRQVVRTIA